MLNGGLRVLWIDTRVGRKQSGFFAERRFECVTWRRLHMPLPPYFKFMPASSPGAVDGIIEFDRAVGPAGPGLAVGVLVFGLEIPADVESRFCGGPSSLPTSSGL